MNWALVPAYAYLAVVSAVLAVIDIRRHLLPNVVTLTSYPIVMVLFSVTSPDRGTGVRRKTLTVSGQ